MDGQTIRAPAKEDTRRLAKQVVVVHSIAESERELSMSGDDSDLDVLQQILDRRLLAPTQMRARVEELESSADPVHE
jgi:hypothetical protein